MMTDKLSAKVASSDAIQSAIHILEKFSKPEEKTFTMLRDILTTTFSKRARANYEKKKGKVKDAVLRAIDILNHHQPLLAQMHQGDQEERQLAESASAAIERFHAVLEHSKHANMSSWISQFTTLSTLKELSEHKIKLPQVATQQKGDQKIRQTFWQSVIGVKKAHPELYEADLLRMKTTSMCIGENGFHMARAEVISILKQATFQYEFDANTRVSKLCMWAEILPGYNLRAETLFQRFSLNKPGLPLSNSFQVHFHGSNDISFFPFCYIGFAVGSRKNDSEVASQLDLHSPVNKLAKARKLVQLKTEAFNGRKELFLNLHHTLIKEIGIASLTGNRDLQKRLEVLFIKIGNESEPFLFLCRGYQAYIKKFVLEQAGADFPKEIFNEDVFAFASLLDQLLSLALGNEMRSKKLQAIAKRQQRYILEELNSSEMSLEAISQRMEAELNALISVLRTPE